MHCEPSQMSNFGQIFNMDIIYHYILKVYARLYQLAKFQVKILLNFGIQADSNSAQNVL